MASSSVHQALDQLPMRPCKGSGATLRLEANYAALNLPKLVVHRFAITIVQLNKDKVEQTRQQAIEKQPGHVKTAPQKSSMPGPGKPATSVKENDQPTGQPATGEQKAPVASPAIPTNNAWGNATATRAWSTATATAGRNAAIPTNNPWGNATATQALKTATITASRNAGIPAGTSPKATTSAPVVKPDLSAAIPSRPSASGGATTTSSNDAIAATPQTSDEQKKGGPAGKKAEQIIKLFLDLPALEEFKNGIFTDFRALLFSTQDLPPHALVQVVRYRAEHNDTATPNALEYLVKLDHTAHFDIASLTARSRANNPQLDVVAKEDSIQALNILFLHYGRSSPSRLSIGSRRTFSSDPTGSSRNIGEGILAMRGYFSSVRVVDYRILVNVNVSHGSFYEAGSLLNLMVKIDRNFKRRPGGLLSILRGIRVGQKHFTDPSGKPLPFQKRTKTIIGFATGADGRFPENQRPDPYHPPSVPRPFAGPEEVMFWYSEPAESSVSADAKGPKATGSKARPLKGNSSEQRGYYISVADYFRKYYPRWPRLDRELPVVNVGSVKQPTYLPVEVCEVMFGQPYKKRLNANQTSLMIKFAVRASHETYNSIKTEGFKAVGLVAEENPQMKFLNIGADASMIVVDGRILMAPILLYNKIDSTGTEYARVRFGGWDLRDVKFRRAQRLSDWSYLNIADENNRRSDLVPVGKAFEGFRKSLAETGIDIKAPTAPDYMKIENASESALQKWISDCRDTYKLDLIVIMLPDKDAHRYNTIKRIGDVEVGIHTICVVYENFCKKDKIKDNNKKDNNKKDNNKKDNNKKDNNKKDYNKKDYNKKDYNKKDKCDNKEKEEYDNKQTFANIALKANLKLQGLNHELNKGFLGIIEAEKTMVVGIDVTHPSPGSESECPSVAAMVASIDGKLGQWPAALSLQYCPNEKSDPRQPWEKKLDPRQEMVSEIGSMLGSRLDLWCKNHSGIPPENILIYRDGVSEGQYEAVLEMELKRMKEYCETYYRRRNQYSPRFTLIVVAKRHHTRFFVYGGNKYVNPVNGTVVDRGVTDDQTWDFFLQSHTPLQGTARPAHYIVLQNQIFSKIADGPKGCSNIADVVERITHNMCYMYSRATKSVSYCPAAYYADRACERGRAYLSRFFNRDPNLQGPQPLATDKDIKVKEPLTDTMFYI